MMSWVPVVNTMNTRFRGGFFLAAPGFTGALDVSDNRHFLANAFPQRHHVCDRYRLGPTVLIKGTSTGAHAEQADQAQADQTSGGGLWESFHECRDAVESL